MINEVGDEQIEDNEGKQDEVVINIPQTQHLKSFLEVRVRTNRQHTIERRKSECRQEKKNVFVEFLTVGTTDRKDKSHNDVLKCCEGEENRVLVAENDIHARRPIRRLESIDWSVLGNRPHVEESGHLEAKLNEDLYDH